MKRGWGANWQEEGVEGVEGVEESLLPVATADAGSDAGGSTQAQPQLNRSGITSAPMTSIQPNHCLIAGFITWCVPGCTC